MELSKLSILFILVGLALPSQAEPKDPFKDMDLIRSFSLEDEISRQETMVAKTVEKIEPTPKKVLRIEPSLRVELFHKKRVLQ